MMIMMDSDSETTAERGGRDQGCWESVEPDEVGGPEEEDLEAI